MRGSKRRNSTVALVVTAAGAASAGLIISLNSAQADIGPIPFPPIPILGGANEATPTTAPSTSPSSSPSTTLSPSPSISASPSTSPSPTPTPSPTPITYNAPVLTQNGGGTTVVYTVRVDTHYSGKTVYFFRRSGMTGKVRPLGTAVVGQTGLAMRTLNDLKCNQVIRGYAKMVGVTDRIKSPYSNDVAIKVCG